MDRLEVIELLITHYRGRLSELFDLAAGDATVLPRIEWHAAEMKRLEREYSLVESELLDAEARRKKWPYSPWVMGMAK